MSFRAVSPEVLPETELISTAAPAGSVWHHIFPHRFEDPLGFGMVGSRFSDPRVPMGYGVYYVGISFEVAFLETIVRDRRNGNPGQLLLSEADLETTAHVGVTLAQPLDLLDLRGGNPLALGIPSDAVRASRHGPGQAVSLAAYVAGLDGIRYPSRLNNDENLAIYDRAIPKLSTGPRRRLIDCPELAPLLRQYRIALM